MFDWHDGKIYIVTINAMKICQQYATHKPLTITIYADQTSKHQSKPLIDSIYPIHKKQTECQSLHTINTPNLEPCLFSSKTN